MHSAVIPRFVCPTLNSNLEWTLTPTRASNFWRPVYLPLNSLSSLKIEPNKRTTNSITYQFNLEFLVIELGTVWYLWEPAIILSFKHVIYGMKLFVWNCLNFEKLCLIFRTISDSQYVQNMKIDCHNLLHNKIIVHSLLYLPTLWAVKYVRSFGVIQKYRNSTKTPERPIETRYCLPAVHPPPPPAIRNVSRIDSNL